MEAYDTLVSVLERGQEKEAEEYASQFAALQHEMGKGKKLFGLRTPDLAAIRQEIEKAAKASIEVFRQMASLHSAIFPRPRSWSALRQVYLNPMSHTENNRNHYI